MRPPLQAVVDKSIEAAGSHLQKYPAAIGIQRFGQFTKPHRVGQVFTGEFTALGVTRMLDEPQCAARWGERGAEDVRLRFSGRTVAQQTEAYYEYVLRNSLDRTPAS